MGVKLTRSYLPSWDTEVSLEKRTTDDCNTRNMVFQVGEQYQKQRRVFRTVAGCSTTFDKWKRWSGPCTYQSLGPLSRSINIQNWVKLHYSIRPKNITNSLGTKIFLSKPGTWRSCRNPLYQTIGLSMIMDCAARGYSGCR